MAALGSNDIEDLWFCFGADRAIPSILYTNEQGDAHISSASEARAARPEIRFGAEHWERPTAPRQGCVDVDAAVSAGQGRSTLYDPRRGTIGMRARA